VTHPFEIQDSFLNVNSFSRFASCPHGWYIKMNIVSITGDISLNTTTVTFGTPKDFNFWRTVYSHGWCSLPPFSVDKENHTLNTILTLAGSSSIRCQVRESKGSAIKITLHSSSLLTAAQRSEAVRSIVSCLRLTEDFSNFYSETRRHPKFRWIAKTKAGRMLRSSSVFEDAVKMICTTNCSWALTEIMIKNLVDTFGKPFDGSTNSFPTPEALAGSSEAFLRKKIKSGYRSPFLLEFAEKVASGQLDVECWRSSDLPTDALFQELRTIKGIGAYSAGNILKLLGRYDYLGLDSWSRGKYYELYHHGRIVKDSTIERRYMQYGKWRGLFFWLEMTKYWYDHEFPF
jgi:3-methyladenine DNA glycosylase/8-oxoguanine DNA glycosylase